MTAPRSLPAELVAAVDAQAGQENFPVALRVLPRPVRADLAALYRYARLVDDIGDAPGVTDREALLAVVEADVRSIAGGDAASTRALVPLGPVFARHRLPLQAFLDLIEANRQDQTTRRYDDWPQLRAYCDLSAAPVGRLVLEVFGSATAGRAADSDDVCAALQLLEHLQDLGEDLRERDRLYLPAATMRAHGVTEADLLAPAAGAPLRAAVLSECERARALLSRGAPLVASLRGWARVAVAGYVAGGLATVAAIEAADGEVLSTLRKPRTSVVARTALRLCAGPSGRGR